MAHTTARQGLGCCIVAVMNAVVATAILLIGCSAAGHSPTRNNATTGRNFDADQSFDLPPKDSFHALSGVTGSVPTNLGCLNDMVMPPGGICSWERQQYYYLLAGGLSALSLDGLISNCKVRKGLKWSNDSALMTKDVYNTFVTRYTMQQLVFNYTKNVELVDDSNAKFTLNSPTPIVVYWIMREWPTPSAQYSTVVEGAVALFRKKAAPDSDEAKVLLARITEARIDQPIVSDPFTINTFTMANSQLTLTLNSNRYRAGKVGYDIITIHNGSMKAITPLIPSGDIHHVTSGSPVATTKQFERQGYTILRSSAYTGPALFSSYDKLLEFEDKRVRQAFTFFLSRSEMGTISLGGSGKGVRHMTGLSDDAIEKWVTPETADKLTAYDPDGARATQPLQKVGWTKNGNQWVTSEDRPAQYDLVFPGDYADWIVTGQSPTEQASALGIKITPIGADSNQQEVDVQGDNFQLAIQARGVSNPLPTDSYNVTLISLNYPMLGKGRGTGFGLQVKANVLGPINLKQGARDSAFGAPEEQVTETTRPTQAFNELLPALSLAE